MKASLFKFRKETMSNKCYLAKPNNSNLNPKHFYQKKDYFTFNSILEWITFS